VNSRGDQPQRPDPHRQHPIIGSQVWPGPQAASVVQPQKPVALQLPPSPHAVAAPHSQRPLAQRLPSEQSMSVAHVSRQLPVSASQRAAPHTVGWVRQSGKQPLRLESIGAHT
jgi:hypothetical protein